VVCEWNSLFGPDHSVSIPYNPLFNRLTAHHSHQYWGASIHALQQLGLKKNYALIGSNQAGNNLFFVRNDRLGRLLGSSAADAWTEAKFSDTRNEQGQLTFLRGKHRSRLIDKLPLVNTRNGQNTSLEQLNQH
jgi:hypothetical protein